MGKPVILCADDFSQNGSVSAAILRLLDAKRLTAVSCMSESPRWRQDAEDLKLHENRVDIGLHFNLTHSFGGQAWRLSDLMRAGWCHRPDSMLIEDSLKRQLDRFESEMRRPPDFVDGHQHVHVFPRIRDIVHKTLAARYAGRLPYLRSVRAPIGHHDALLKAAILRLLARNADREAAAEGFLFPSGFAGLYSLSALADYGQYMRAWLAAAPAGTLIMCHPGIAGDDTGDPIRPARAKEMEYLLSDAFAEALAKTDACLARFQAI